MDAIYRKWGRETTLAQLFQDGEEKPLWQNAITKTIIRQRH